MRRCASVGRLFFNEPSTPEFYTLSLHDALPISGSAGDRGAIGSKGQRHVERRRAVYAGIAGAVSAVRAGDPYADRKSTRLNSSHLGISYAVFSLKKKKTKRNTIHSI